MTGKEHSGQVLGSKQQVDIDSVAPTPVININMARVAPSFCMSGFQYSSSRDSKENPVVPAILPSQHPVYGQECRMIEKGNNHRELVHGIGALPRGGEIVSKSKASKEMTTIVSRENLEMRRKSLMFMASSEKEYREKHLSIWGFLSGISEGNLNGLQNF